MLVYQWPRFNDILSGYFNKESTAIWIYLSVRCGLLDMVTTNKISRRLIGINLTSRKIIYFDFCGANS